MVNPVTDLIATCEPLGCTSSLRATKYIQLQKPSEKTCLANKPHGTSFLENSSTEETEESTSDKFFLIQNTQNKMNRIILIFQNKLGS